MPVRVKYGAAGTDVERLHRVLNAAGLEIALAERRKKTFGPSTLAALKKFQTQHGLTSKGRIDKKTLAVLHDVEATLTTVRQGTVRGKFVDADGAAIASARMSLFAQRVRDRSQLASTVTAGSGAFLLTYQRTIALNLIVQALGADGKPIAESPVFFAAPADLQIDLTTAKSGVVPTPSAHTALSASISTQLLDTPLPTLKQDKDDQELDFVAKATGAAFTDVARLYLARRIATANKLNELTLYGIFSQGLPAPLDTALAKLPDAGIDDAFIKQVLAGVLAHSTGSLSRALDAALAANVLPASYAAQQAGELARLDALRVQRTGAAPYIRGKTPLSDLLTAANVDAAVSAAFTQAYASSGNRLGPTWKALRANKTFTKGQLAVLNTALNVGELLGGNLVLVKETMQRLTQGTLASVQELALLDEADWVAKIKELDPQATTIPPVLVDDTPAQRIARFAKALAERFASRYLTTAFLGGLTRTTASSFAAKDELVSVLTANPKFNLRRTHVDKYIAKNKVQISAAALGAMKTLQRLSLLSPHYATVEALNAAGYQSAQAVYFKGRAPFVAHMTPLLGSAPRAEAAWVRAQARYASALAAFGRYNLALNGTTVALMASPVPPPDAVANLPDLQVLFGSFDSCQCSDCRSLLSPAAYFVDLLQFLKQRGALTALLSRRPDLQFIALGCGNTDVTLPYIDVVNELLESAIAPPVTPVTVIETEGRSAERRALPQQVLQAAYDKTASAVFPLTLPLDLSFAETAAFLKALGTRLDLVMQLCGSGSAAARAAAQLALNPAMQAVINGTDTHQPWARWGFTTETNPANVYDPKTRQRLTPAPADWIAAMAKVPVLLGRANLNLAQLSQLLEVEWVTRGSVTLKLGSTVQDNVDIASCDTELMTFDGLDAAVLDRANRFLRMWTSCQLQMWELDWALETAGGNLDDAFLVFLANALTIRERLKLPLQELLSFWGPMPVHDVASHLGEVDSIVPSTYNSVFRSPTLLASWSAVFVDSGALPGGPIDPNAIKAALGLSADDVAAIAAATGATIDLSLGGLNVLFRHGRLASSLSLTVPDLLLWMTLCDALPSGAAPAFGGTPADTAEFLRRFALLQATGVSLHDLDYLLRHGSATVSEMTFTAAQATAALQTIRDAIAKLTPAAQTDPVTLQTLFVSALSAATGVTADVVAPALASTAALPLAAATIAQLLAQTNGVDPTQFPPLVDAFTRVAKAAALSTALKPTASEFSFLVQNAASFNWVNPAALPLSAPAGSIYPPFERLIQALQLNRRQSARSPKFFDVLAGWVVALPSTVSSAIANDGGALAVALNGSVPDLTALAGALSAKTPSLTAGTQAGSLADMSMVTAIGAALDAGATYHIGSAALVQLAATPPNAASASAAMGILQARYAPAAWFGAVQPVEDKLRELRRDALVSYLVGPGPAVAITPPLLDSDDIFNRFLIDPEMCACGMTTRLLEASLAVQQFVQQCFLGLVVGVAVDATVDPGWNQWSWMSQFRLWQANRQVFLYPENYLLPELRKDKSPFFADLEDELKQTTCNADSATAAVQNYLRKLVDVRNLVVAAHYHETRADGSRVLHVFGRTRGKPPKWYYRAREEGSLGSGIWSPWRALNVDIASDQIVPLVWDQRLHVVWPIFKQISEKANTQNIPTTNGGVATPSTAPPALKFWSIEFAMSEFSAGQWQAKRTYTEKCYVESEAPALAFTFRAYPDPESNLRLEIYLEVHWVSNGTYSSVLVSTGLLPMPDAPLTIYSQNSLPAASAVDLSQEPSYALITSRTQFPNTIVTAANYRFWGQDLVAYGPNPGSVNPVAVLALPGSKSAPVSLTLLNTMNSQRIVVPMQEMMFDSADAFFVADPSRTFFVTPHYYTVSSSPQELENLAYIPQWTTSYAFAPFYHPFARTFLRELELGGTDRLMLRNLQINPQAVRGPGTFDFAGVYAPQPPVLTPYPVEDVDFSVSGAYSLYNWELFYHAPMFVATQLMRNQQYQDAMRWLQYIFDPTDPNPAPVPGHFWRTRPFYEMNAGDWLAQQIQKILTTLSASAQQGSSDPDTASALQDWLGHPFDPHRIARLRIGAYGKATVMRFLDNLIAWGDSLFAQYTMEKVAQAAQLYVFADLILGPRPEHVRLRDADLATKPDATTYAAIQAGLDEFSNELVAVENVIAAPTPALQTPDDVDQAPALPQISTLFFCIPPNQQLLAYWDTVADRLYKIRHCLNLQGVAQPLALYAPPISPLALIEQAASGAGGFGAAPFTPVYRFAVYLERALELTNDVRSYGAVVLAALEKKDAEALSALRTNQEVDIQTRLLDIKTRAVSEAQNQLAALQNQKAAVQIRYDFYANVEFMNAWEFAAIHLQAQAVMVNLTAVPLDLASSEAHMIPNFTFGATGWAGSPTAVTEVGGGQMAASLAASASALRGIAGIFSESGGMVATMGGYQRRMDEWSLQKDLATAELVQLDSQIAAANDRLTMANSEVDLQTRQIANAQAVIDFLTDKYTNEQLYDFILTQLTTVHTQAYQLAFALSQQAQAAYQYELGSEDTFVQFGYWDVQHKGLTAGESLLFDLRRMQAQYLATNTREIELIKHVSLALVQPIALVQLLQTGRCDIALDEALFDRDHPGHYFRRLRSVAITVPCVTGPYSGVNATLTLGQAKVRVQPPVSPYAPALARDVAAAPAFAASAPAATVSISTSHGQNDAGLFDVNLRDERWLPFEGQGAISTWTLELDPRDNTFDLSTITDVVLHVRYSARSAGGDPQAVRQALKPSGPQQFLLSVRSSFSDAYYAFFNPADPAATQQVLTLPLQANVFPFSNLGVASITDISINMMLIEVPATGTEIANATFGPTGGATTPVAIPQVPPPSGGGPVAALAAATGQSGPPGSFTLTVPEAGIPAALATTSNGHARLDASKFTDILLVVSYKIA